MAATVACSSVSKIVSPPSVSVKSAWSAFASRLSQLSPPISGDAYRSIRMNSPLNAIQISPLFLLMSLLFLPYLKQKRCDCDGSVHHQPGVGNFQLMALAAPVTGSVEAAQLCHSIH